MKKKTFHLAFVLGAVALLWVALMVARSHPLVLAMTAVMALVYGIGAMELWRFRQTTSNLEQALTGLPEVIERLEDWLDRVPEPLRNPVRQRIEGERMALPGPSLTPYLVGLLVMLGMLGTFLGMVITLNGAVFALEASTGVQGMRAAFSEPIRGLGLAFGTSVAGVATSAMLGLMSSLSRQDRGLATQTLDRLVATRLRRFSLAFQRQEGYRALQQQAQALPQVFGHLQDLLERVERQNEQSGQRLLALQDGFHREVRSVYSELARSIEHSMRQSVNDSITQASLNVGPVVHASLQELAAQAQDLHERMRLSLEQTAQRITSQMAQQAHQTLDNFRQLAVGHEELMRMRMTTETQWAEQQSQRSQALASMLRLELTGLREQEALRADAAVARLQELQAVAAQHLGQLGQALEAPINRLVETASEAPRAAAEVIGQLRQEMVAATARENAMLEERSRILQTLSRLIDEVGRASTQQQGVIENLVSATQTLLERSSERFEAQVERGNDKLEALAAQVSASAIDVASLGESFAFSVHTFSETQERLMASLQHIETTLSQSMARSDEQLAYYVAQAREIIELSLGSQREVLQALHQRQTEVAV